MPLALTPDLIQLAAAPTHKEHAIEMLAALLQRAGHVQAGYAASMLSREQQANTWLGHAVAIPHGSPAQRDLVLKTGIAVLQVPAGVAWSAEGERARLIIGIAARGDEHIGVLRQLTRILGDGALIDRLAATLQPQDIIDALQADIATPQATNSVGVATGDPNSVRASFIMDYATGLHARPATVWAATAKRYEATVDVSHAGQTANGKSMLALLQLGLETGALVTFSAVGPDAPQAVEALLHEASALRTVEGAGPSSDSAAVLVVSCNPALDQTVTVSALQPGEVQQAENSVLQPGGKGVNVAAGLAATGHAVTLTGLFGKDNLAQFVPWLEQRGIAHALVEVAGATRTNIKLVDAQGTTDINLPGFTVAASQQEALEQLIDVHAANASWVVLSGSLPPGVPAAFYRYLTAMLHQHRVKVALDTSGAALQASLAAGDAGLPDLIKPNRHELEQWAGKPLPTAALVLETAQALQRSGIAQVLVSLGAEGALLVTADGHWWAQPAALASGSTVGAGDAMLAGFVAAQIAQLPPDSALCQAMAYAGARLSLNREWPLQRAHIQQMASTVHVDHTMPVASAVASAVPAMSAGPGQNPLRIIAITSCPTGIAHTFMAAEALEQAGRQLGHAIHVETQGSVGAQNALKPAQIADADLVIIAADAQVDQARFAGKRVYRSGTKAAINDGQALIKLAAAEASVWQSDTAGSPAESASKESAASNKGNGPYKHLMTGVSYMLPLVVAGGLLIALAFAVGGIYAYDDSHKGTLAWALFQIGAKGAFALMVPVLSAYIAWSIVDRPGLTPGLVGGMLANTTGAGFLGGIVAGFIAGYATRYLNQYIRLPRNLAGLKPVLILPLLSTLIVGLLMLYVIGEPVAVVLQAMSGWLKGLQGSSALMLGAILGAMMAIDMGGPVNKAAYAFSTGLVVTGVCTPMAAVMAAGMTPPLGIALACWLFKNRFSAEDREAAKAAAVLGLAFITEGAIPYAARDPMRVIPSCVLGSTVAGAISLASGAALKVPHGGIFVLPIPDAISHLGMYVVALLAGTCVTALALFVLKPPLNKQAVVAA
ncbi:1-phosphofructokinase [Amantichitinum ursilacus]|uniref:1-phosphofructokinase n=1 Tax=Amantichitinum ursilacus TaxID=857265 RepID=A0A0N0GR84_9NEIS|nr:1-phosphofructokinase [Amantichitinum ursilacus]KPC55418.1 PTS system fructose-specific EIIBC component [Amantichitinum ursilacus]